MFVDFYRMCGRNLPQDYYLAIVVKKIVTIRTMDKYQIKESMPVNHLLKQSR